MIKKYLKNTVAMAVLISALQATEVQLINGIPQDFDLQTYQTGVFNERYASYKKGNDLDIWNDLLSHAIREGHRNVVHFLLTHKDCTLTKKHVWSGLSDYGSKHPELLSFMLTKHIPSKYEITRDMIYSKKGDLSLSVQNIKDILAIDGWAPKDEEESNRLYYRVYVMNEDMEEVTKLFAALPDLLPRLTRKSYEEGYSYDIKQGWNAKNANSYGDRNKLRTEFLEDLPETPSELEDKRRKAEETAELNGRLAEGVRQAWLKEQERLALWDKPLPGPLKLNLTPDSAADIWQALYGVVTPLLSHRGFVVPEGTAIQFKEKGGTLTGKLMSVTATKTTYGGVKTLSYGIPQYDSTTSTVLEWNTLRDNMQKNQKEQGFMYVSKTKGQLHIVYSFGLNRKPIDLWEYRFYLENSRYMERGIYDSLKDWGASLSQVLSLFSS